MTTILRSAASVIAAFALTAFAIFAPAAAQAPAKITIVVFGFPSLGAFMPPVIKAQKLDTAQWTRYRIRRAPAGRLHDAVQLG